MPWNTIIYIALVFALRVFGFMAVLPLIISQQHVYSFANPLLLGVAIGVYGLMQALFNLFFGILSDRIGRKPVIYLGLGLMCLGSLIAYCSTSVYGLIVGRALQGCGAIGSTLMALITDIVPQVKRGQAMACVGAAIGGSFWLAIVIGPLLGNYLGLANIFLLMAGLALVAMLIVWLKLPVIKSMELQPSWQQCITLLVKPKFMPYDLGVAVLHAVFTINIALLPSFMLQHYQIASVNIWEFLLPCLVVSVLVAFPLIMWAEKKSVTNSLINLAWILISMGCISLSLQFGGMSGVMLGIVGFFIGFNLLEALLMAGISKLALKAQRGAVMGGYSTCQFFGIFLGGVIGGWCKQKIAIDSVFLVSFALMFIWGLFWLLSTLKSKVNNVVSV